MRSELIRGNFNELITLLEYLSSSKLDSIEFEFPMFAKEIRSGPDAGIFTSDDNLVVERAKLTVRACMEICENVEKLKCRALADTRLTKTFQVAAELASSLAGSTALISLGLSEYLIAKIVASLTLFLIVLNVLLNHLRTKYSPTVLNEIIKLQSTANFLALECQKLTFESSLDHVNHERILQLIESCNERAREINLEKDSFLLLR